MPRFARTCLFIASAAALGFVSRGARAQTTAPTSTATTTGVATPCVATPGGQPTVSVTQQLVPTRIVGGKNIGSSTRPPSLNPNGVSFSDCAEDMVLEFTVTACNFTGQQNLQVWASRTSDCTAATDRGQQGGISQCWLVSPGSTGLIASQTTQTYDIRVQDIVGPENDSPSPVTMQSFGSSACDVQSTFLAVPININFVPIDSGTSSAAGPAFQYILATDLVGPPPPVGVQIKDGDTLFVVDWTPNLDSDTGGYDVLIDPIPGMEPASALNMAASGGATGASMVVVCPADAGVPATTAEDAGDGAVTDGATDATVTTPASPMFAPDAALDGGCYPRQMSGSGAMSTSNGGTCNDAVLTGALLADGGSSTPVAPVEEFDDAGNVIDSGVATATTGGGIFVPPPGHVVSPNPTTGTTATGATNSTFTISGLKNGVTYTVAVSAVDNFGNIGPPSTQQCDFPAPVNDFWKIYRTSGGEAGGGFCALEAVGAPAGTTIAFAGAGALVLAGLRRRRRKRR